MKKKRGREFILANLLKIKKKDEAYEYKQKAKEKEIAEQNFRFNSGRFGKNNTM